MKKRIKYYRFRLISAYWAAFRKVADTLIPLRNKVFYKPIYYYYFSCDCDCCEREYYGIYHSGRKNFERWIQHIMEWADGPITIQIVDKAEYEKWMEMTGGKTRSRDRVLEAYENGRGTSIYV